MEQGARPAVGEGGEGREAARRRGVDAQGKRVSGVFALQPGQEALGSREILPGPPTRA